MLNVERIAIPRVWRPSIPGLRSAAVLASFLFATVILPPAAQGDLEPKSPTISIPKGASQEEALNALHRSTGRLVLAERPTVGHRCQKEVNDLSLDQLLPHFTADYHLHALVGAKELLFVRRFWDPREEPDVPIPEIAAIASDLHRLFDLLSPHFESLRFSFERREFYRSLSPEQIAAAQRGELTYLNMGAIPVGGINTPSRKCADPSPVA